MKLAKQILKRIPKMHGEQRRALLIPALLFVAPGLILTLHGEELLPEMPEIRMFLRGLFFILATSYSLRAGYNLRDIKPIDQVK